jgi:hypothetical protein
MRTLVAMTAEATDSDTLPESPARRYPLAEGNDAADDLMSGHARLCQRRISSLNVSEVCATNAARFHLNQHLAVSGGRYFAHHEFQSARSGNLHGAIGCFHAPLSN